ncbi:hypothetical protein [Roseiflexus sp.]|uniref:hypothetical protein n=1 Tax=Roseiflexus sp. TaxID=2562120 RepID=UPI00398B6CAF
MALAKAIPPPLLDLGSFHQTPNREQSPAANAVITACYCSHACTLIVSERSFYGPLKHCFSSPYLPVQ